jgi:hypothetical protein
MGCARARWNLLVKMILHSENAPRMLCSECSCNPVCFRGAIVTIAFHPKGEMFIGSAIAIPALRSWAEMQSCLWAMSMTIVKQRALADVHLGCRGSIQVLLISWLIMRWCGQLGGTSFGCRCLNPVICKWWCDPTMPVWSLSSRCKDSANLRETGVKLERCDESQSEW